MVLDPPVGTLTLAVEADVTDIVLNPPIGIFPEVVVITLLMLVDPESELPGGVVRLAGTDKSEEDESKRAVDEIGGPGALSEGVIVDESSVERPLLIDCSDIDVELCGSEVKVGRRAEPLVDVEFIPSEMLAASLLDNVGRGSEEVEDAKSVRLDVSWTTEEDRKLKGRDVETAPVDTPVPTKVAVDLPVPALTDTVPLR